MAKVYSWDLGNNLFSYIIKPEHATKINNNEAGFTVNNAEPLVGTSELKGENLEAVKTWTANANIEDYTLLYNKMAASAEIYGISFGMVDNYIFANSVSDCDNLRGRGIKSIESIGSNIIQKDDGSYHTVNRCLVTYDDGTTSELNFDVKNGADGKDGRNGNDGAKGDMGIATRTVFAFASGKDGNIPLQPQGGSWDGRDTVIYPDGWGPNDGIEPPVYMSNRTFATVESAQDKYWSVPTMISGKDGQPGADGVNIEFIYKRYKVALSVPPSTENLDSENVDDFTPSGWSDSPSGVDEENRVEYVASRKRKDGVWSAWSPATIWSQYGVNGQDGDGVQYIYFLNNGNISEVVNPTPSDYKTNEKYQEKDTEWLPSKGEYRNHNNDIVTIDDIHYWTDDPRGVSSTMQYEWVCQRKYRKSADGDKQAWQAFSEPTLWAKFGENGTNGTSIRTMYDVTPSTGDVPAFNKYDINPGGSWQLGFPEDYEYGENVVWGINATIYGNTNEFVGEYKQVLDSNEEPVKPLDATTSNTLTVYAIPNTKVENEDIKYLIFDKVYYQWVKTGWEGPFLVTGTKGSDGTPIDYSITVFCFASKDYPPQAPDTNVERDNIGSSKDELGISREWYSLPDATIGVDGEVVNDLVMRWYRCNGMVDSATQRVYKWGAVEVNSPMDGETMPGKYLEYRYAVTPDDEKPDTNFFENGKVIPEPELIIDGEKVGWFTTSANLPERKDGGVIWQIWTWKDGATNEVLEGEIWYGPSRLTGDKGDVGPVGKRGVTGIPGAGYMTLYSLGNENEPFGTDEWRNYNNKSYGPLKENFKTWFEPCPDDTIIQVDTIEKAQEKCVVANIGRIVHVYNITEETGTSTPTINSDDYYLISKSVELEPIDKSKTELEEGRDEFVPYIWMIQGSEVWESGKSEMYVKLSSKPKDATDKNTLNEPESLPTTEQTDYKYVLYNGKYYSWQELEGTEVTHNKVGIAWEPPFRTQGISGLRGMSGSRGQVVYPMGVYNENEVYMVTEDKAPYVYDSSDGLFYVYNEPTFPWVGSFPPNPEGWEEGKKWQECEEYKDVEEVIPYYMTIKHVVGYNDEGEAVEDFKYRVNGIWITGDQEGDRPCSNYANKTNDNRKPAWVKFESFEALYTNIGIIENGMIGSAVYNNEFMFSQQGIKRDGGFTNYAEESKGPLIKSGFLSGYEWVQNGKNIDGKGFCNWQYRGTTEWIADKDVNPYEVYNANNSAYTTSILANEGIEKPIEGVTPIHRFRPNVVINFKTGEMWTSAGKVNFDADGSGYLLDGSILWDYAKDADGNIKPLFQIGKTGEKGIRFSGGTMTIDVLEDYKEENKKYLEEEFEKVQTDLNEINRTILGLGDDIQNQIDGKANTWYQSEDPAIEWHNSSDKSPYTSAEEHLGDMWFDTDDNKSYVFSDGDLESDWKEGLDYKKIDAEATGITSPHQYYWRVASIPMSVYDTFDGKANIFVECPSGQTYHVGDMWLVESDTYKNETFADKDTANVIKGTILIAIQSADTSFFSFKHWSKKDRYTDDTTALAAKAQLEFWSQDGIISPTERKSISDIGQQIIAEYPGITEQCKQYKINTTGYSEYTTYTAATTAATSTTEFYSSKDNCNTGTTEVKDSIVISSSTFTNTNKVSKGVKEDYSNIERYYDARAKLQNLITNTVFDLTTGITKDYFDSANTYTNNQISAISGATKTLVDNLNSTLQGNIDGKANTYTQTTDPSANWSTTSGDSNFVAIHEGDVWYNTNSGTTQIFSSLEGEHSITTAFNTNNSDYETKYYWNRTDLPLEIFDYSDGKSSIYINNDADTFTGYTENDMWVVPSSAKENLGKWANNTGLTLICTGVTKSMFSPYNEKTSIATEYHENDWVKLDRYTDDSFAQEKFNAWASDGWINPSEMRALSDEADAIAVESATTNTMAVSLDLHLNNPTYGPEDGNVIYKDYTAFTTMAYETAKYYSNSANTNVNDSEDAYYGAIKVTAGTSTIDAGVATYKKYYGNIAKYYECREKLQNAIINASESKAYKTSYSASSALTEQYFESANTYTNMQIEVITDTANKLAETIERLQGDVDGKAEMYSQDTDPSSDWKENEEWKKHLGDIWYNTSSSSTQYFTNEQPTVGTYISAVCENNCYWVRTDLALEIFDYSDGKSTLFISVNPTGYCKNDLWIIPSTQTNNLPTNAKVGDTVVCTNLDNVTTETTAGGKESRATQYQKSNWSKLDRYTDDTFAKEKFNAWANDGWINLSEMRALNDEADAIAAESSTTKTAADSLGLSASTPTYGAKDGYSAYTSYTKFAAMAYETAKYYGNSGNSSNLTDTDDPYYGAIAITGGTSTDLTNKDVYKKYYGNIEQYYINREKLQNAVIKASEDKAYKSSKEYADTQYKSATAYTSTQINAINSGITSINTTLINLQGDVDGKAEMYSQPTDPSSAWKTVAEADKHKGDIWYNTNSGSTQTFTNVSGGTCIEAATTAGTYYWVRTDMPLELFDYSDGKSTLYVCDNPSGYQENDLWIIPSTQTSNLPAKAKVGDTVVCTSAITANTNTGKTTGGHVYATKYRKEDWSKLDRYTDDSYAKNKFTDWASDYKISPVEREALKRELDAIKQDYSGTTGSSYYSTSWPGHTNFNNAFTKACKAISAHTNSTGDTAIEITGKTTTNGDTDYGWISQFHVEKQKARKYVDEQIQNSAVSASTGTTASYKDDMAKQLGYSDYDDMVSDVKTNGSIIQEGGYLNAGLIEASAITADMIAASAITADKIAANAITADMISGTVANIVSAEIKDLTVEKLDTKLQQTNTIGKVSIQNNEINVYANAIDYNEVVKITGQNMPTIKSGETLTLNTNISELFEGSVQGTGGDYKKSSIKTLSKFTTPTGYCNYRIMIDTAPIIAIDFNYSGRLDEQTPVAGMDVDCLFKIRELGSSVDTVLTRCSYRRHINYDDPTAPSSFGSYVTGGTNTEIVLKRNTTYEFICSTTVENLCDPSIDGYVSLSRIGKYKLEESLNKLDVGVDGMRYVISSNAMFECYKTSKDTLNVTIKSNKNYGLSVTDTGITLTLSGTTYKLGTNYAGDSLTLLKLN